jgi:hypothetical protein
MSFRRRLGSALGFVRPQYRYLREILILLRSRPGDFTLGNIVPYYSAWNKLAFGGGSALNDAQPWLAFAAIRFLESHLKSGMRVFEYGSGGSTAFYAKRVAEIHSIEHDSDWYERVCQSLNERGLDNCDVRYVGPRPMDTSKRADPANPEDYASLFEGFENSDFTEYAKAIDGFDDGSFDLVVVDGRARPSCAKHAMAKVKPGGYILFDNSERPHYSGIQEALAKSGWTRRAFYGPHSYVISFSCTAFWRKPI